jgi:hypothetical protein
MLRVKLVLLSLSAVVALSAASVSPAFAAVYRERGGAELAAGTDFEGVVGRATVATRLANTPINIECVFNTFHDEVEAGGKSKGKWEFQICLLFERGMGDNHFVNCHVTISNNAGKTNVGFKDALIEEPLLAEVENEFKPNPETSKFMVIEIANCAAGEAGFEGTTEVTGFVVASFAEGYRALTEHELKFTSEGNALKAGTKVVDFEVEVSRLKTTNNREWYVGT